MTRLLEDFFVKDGHNRGSRFLWDNTHDTIMARNPLVDLEAGVNFVFGTTGGDRDALMKVTQESGVYAVIEAWTSMILW